MSKTKMILATIGGISLVGAVVSAYLLWTAVQRKDELAEEISSAVSTVESLSGAKVHPSTASIAAVASNVTRIAEWKADILRTISAGDRVYEKTTAPAFKNFIVSEAKRLANLPGGADGKIAKASFAFGPFKEYIFEGKMPAEASLGELQRKWDDVVFIVETLASAGISEITDIQLKAVEAPGREVATGRNARQKKRAKAQKGAAEDAKKEPAMNAWAVSFETRPAGYVKMLNSFALSKRFAAVGDVAVTRKGDGIAAALGGEQKKDEASRQTGRRRRRGASLSESDRDESSQKLKDGIVNDPATDEPLKVSMTVEIYDFRSLETDETHEEEDSKTKGESK